MNRHFTDPHKTSIASLRVATLALALSALTGCGATVAGDHVEDQAPSSSDEAETGSFGQAVQKASSGFFDADFANFKHDVTGVLFIQIKEEPLVMGSCGVTFISPHFAVTAAHCVPKDKITIGGDAPTGFFVFNYNADALGLRILLGEPGLQQKFTDSTTVQGTFPNYTTKARLTGADGYTSSSWFPLCFARVRCSRTYGKDNCPASLRDQGTADSAGVKSGVDIALIECPYRTAGQPFTTVVTGDEPAGMAVEAHWSHEVLNLARTPTENIGPAGNWANYGAYNGSALENNWHYRGLTQNQFLPLISKTFPNGTTYKTIGSPLFAGDTERRTDMFGCHGTSGSGVFPQNSDKLLGPVVNGLGGWTGSNLCAPTSGHAAGNEMTTFVRPRFTREIEKLSMVTNDRNAQ